MSSLPKREEALTLAKRRFIEYKTLWNDVSIISDLRLHERTTHIILDESLSHVVKNMPNEPGGRTNILERKLDFHPLLETPKNLRSGH
jgi:hypothetical protein